MTEQPEQGLTRGQKAAATRARNKAKGEKAKKVVTKSANGSVLLEDLRGLTETLDSATEVLIGMMRFESGVVVFRTEADNTITATYADGAWSIEITS